MLIPQFAEAVARFASVADMLYETDQYIEEYKRLAAIQDRLIATTSKDMVRKEHGV
jgi:hypothetical protein